MQQKHLPIRTCIATGEKRPKNELLRLVLTPDNEITVDLKGKAKGRGANIIPSLAAFELALKNKAMEKAFKLKKKLIAGQIDKLRQEFVNAIAQKEFRQGSKPVSIKIQKAELQQVTTK